MTAEPSPVRTTDLTLWDRTRRLGVRLDPATGLPAALIAADGHEVTLRAAVTLNTEGREVPREPFGLAYADTVDLTDLRLVSREIAHEFTGHEETHTVRTAVGGWAIDWEYRFRLGTPRIEVAVVLAPTEAQGTLRNLHVDLTVVPDDLDGWTVHAPGSGLRPDIEASEITGQVAVSESCFSGSGILVLADRNAERSLLLWPFSRTEHAINRLEVADGAIRFSVETGVAGRVSPGERLRWGAIALDLLDGGWDAIRPSVPSWFDSIGVATLRDTAAWIPGCTIFEVQIGTSVFWNGYEYSPYPTVRDLHADLGRIAGLGYDVIQIMPRQPFPSYNVMDYDDITLSYGDEDDLRALVEAAHALGMRVILDILMHGVIDEVMIRQAADRVRRGPYAARLEEGTEIVPDEAFLAYRGQDYLVGWARHIIDFEEHWAGGSPGAHPMLEQHPDWFLRKSDGEIIGVYTRAFDNANVAWQEHFTGVALELVRRLDVDGFRFDAPTYNEVPNWSPATERRASASQLGSVGHFARLRPELKALKPDAMLYTEPAGTLFRETMDIVYNYDEHGLIHAVLRPQYAQEDNPLGVRHARDLAAWMRDKEAALPRGAITARHVDSHDTFWWPLPGFKWRREQYGLPATRAIVATFSLIGGVFMTFVGGEAGLEDDIRRINALRDTLPEIRHGRGDYDAVQADDDRIFATVRRHAGQTSLVLVNLSDAEVETTVALDTAVLGDPGGRFRVDDVWNEETLTHGGAYTWAPDDLGSFPLTFAPYQPRVLTLRPAERPL